DRRHRHDAAWSHAAEPEPRAAAQPRGYLRQGLRRLHAFLHEGARSARGLHDQGQQRQADPHLPADHAGHFPRAGTGHGGPHAGAQPHRYLARKPECHGGRSSRAGRDRGGSANRIDEDEHHERDGSERNSPGAARFSARLAAAKSDGCLEIDSAGGESMKRLMIATTVALVFGLGGARAQSEITLIAPGGIRAAIEQLIPGFEKKTGHKIKATFGSGLGTKRQVAKGEAFDVPIVQPPYPEVLSSGNVVANT